MDLTTILLEMAALLLGLHTLLLGLRTLLLDLALPQTTPPLDRFSKLRLGRNCWNSMGLELGYHARWQEAFQYIMWFSASFPFLPSFQLLLVTPLPAFLSYAGAQLGVYLGASASLGDVHLASISKLPPLVPFIKLPTFPAFIKFQYLCFPPSLSATSCIHLVSVSKLPPRAPQQLPAFIWFHTWPPRNFLQASCFNILKLSHTCASQQLPAFMQFLNLGFPPSSLHNFLHASSFGFNV